MTRFTSPWSTITVCSSPPQSNELFHDLSPSTIPIIADGPSPDESMCRLSLRSRSDVEETFTKRKCSLNSQDERENNLDTVSMILCQSGNEDHPQFSHVKANHPNPDADTDTEMTSNDSTGSHTESPPSSSSTASPTSGSFKVAKITQVPCCSRPRIATKAPKAAASLPSLSSTLQSDTNPSTNSPATDESTATTTTPYRFCTSCDTFMGFCPDATVARRKSSILEPIRMPNMAVDAPAPPAPAAPLFTAKPCPPQPGSLANRKPKQQQQQGRPPNPPPVPTRFRDSQRSSMDPPPLQRKRPLEPPFEDKRGAKSMRWDPFPDYTSYHHQHHHFPPLPAPPAPPPPRIRLTSPSPPASSLSAHNIQHIQPRRPPHPSIPYYNYPNRDIHRNVPTRPTPHTPATWAGVRRCACGIPAVSSVAAGGGGRAWVCGNTRTGRGGKRCGFFVRG